MKKTEYKAKFFDENGINCVLVENLEHFDVGQIFDCGQCFRFDPIESKEGEVAVGGVAFDRYVEFVQSGDKLKIRNSTLEEYESIWKHYLSLDQSYEEIKDELKKNMNSEVFNSAVDIGHGIRILRQEPWECVCSFIISQNNNIPRIKKIISSMCEKYGNKIEFDGKTYYGFPSFEILYKLGVDKIFELKTGFRAKYIYDAAEKVTNKEILLDEMFGLDTSEALEKLCAIKGIGPKVASCALLFGFEKYDAFPIDVWVKKIIAKYFENGLDVESIGKYAGIAQQYLFYYERYVVAQSEK